MPSSRDRNSQQMQKQKSNLIKPVVISVVLVWITSYLTSKYLLATYKYKYSFEYNFYNVEPKELCNFFGDFGNHAKINPTMLEYEVISSSTTDKGRSRSIKVKYREQLVHIPFIVNENEGTLTIIEPDTENGSTTGKVPTTQPTATASPGTNDRQHVRQVYMVNSTHITRQLGISMYSSDEMTFTYKQHGGKNLKATKLHQTIEYECQLIFSWYCQLEFVGQRKLIQSQLKKMFDFVVEREFQISI